jgi:hypothetical protein
MSDVREAPMSTAIVCVLVWFVGWMLWYRLEWKTLARDNPKFTDQERREILLGSTTWPFQFVLFMVVTPILLVMRALGWKSKEEEDP